MDERYGMTRQEWMAYAKEVRSRAATRGATLTPQEWRDALLFRIVERVEVIERDVTSIRDDVR